MRQTNLARNDYEKEKTYTIVREVPTVKTRIKNFIVLKEECSYEEDEILTKFEELILKNPIYALPAALVMGLGVYVLVVLLLALQV